MGQEEARSRIGEKNRREVKNKGEKNRNHTVEIYIADVMSTVMSCCSSSGNIDGLTERDIRSGKIRHIFEDIHFSYIIYILVPPRQSACETERGMYFYLARNVRNREFLARNARARARVGISFQLLFFRFPKKSFSARHCNVCHSCILQYTPRYVSYT